MKYANELLHTDVRPYQVTRVVSPITLVIRAMKVERDPDWTPDMTIGGFAAHCHNNDEQRWLYHENADGEVLRIRKTKRGWMHKGRRFLLSDTPVYFYDYNF